jgi:hypothetical protein
MVNCAVALTGCRCLHPAPGDFDTTCLKCIQNSNNDPTYIGMCYYKNAFKEAETRENSDNSENTNDSSMGNNYNSVDY